MKVGLVGYAGSGKSTAFQWLTGATPDPSKIQQGQSAVADVPDDRLRAIAPAYNPKKLTFAKVEFLDTPGLMADERKDNPRRLGILRDRDHGTRGARMCCQSEPSVRSLRLWVIMGKETARSRMRSR